MEPELPEPQAIAEFVHKMIEHLKRPNPPKEGGCSHFGVGLQYQDFNIDVSQHGTGDDLFVGVYRSITYTSIRSSECLCCGHKTENRSYVEGGIPKLWFDALQKHISDQLQTPIVSSWNGEEGHHGVSLVLLHACPPALLEAHLRAPKTSGSSFWDWFLDSAPEGPPRTQPKVEHQVFGAKSNAPQPS